MNYPEGNEQFIVKFKQDNFLYLDVKDGKPDSISYKWNTNTDSILINKFVGSVFVKKLDEDSLIAIWENLQLTFLKTE